MQPADQMSTATESKASALSSESESRKTSLSVKRVNRFTGLRVVHPVEDDLGRPVPARHDVAGHLCVRLPRQAKIQNLKQKRNENQNLQMFGMRTLKQLCVK